MENLQADLTALDALLAQTVLSHLAALTVLHVFVAEMVLNHLAALTMLHLSALVAAKWVNATL